MVIIIKQEILCENDKQHDLTTIYWLMGWDFRLFQAIYEINEVGEILWFKDNIEGINN